MPPVQSAMAFRMASTCKALAPKHTASPSLMRAVATLPRQHQQPPTKQSRLSYSTAPTSPFSPRHFLTIADLTPAELAALVRNSAAHKSTIKSGRPLPNNLSTSLLNRTLALLFTKRSTRTRVSTEAAINHLGGTPLFLGSGDVQLGVNESLYDTSVVVSSMVNGIVARVNKHEEVAEMAKWSTVPVVNALSDAFHPMQAIADYLTLHEAFPAAASIDGNGGEGGLGLEGLKVAWVGDANNVLFDLAIAAAKLGVTLSVATPKGFEIPGAMKETIASASPDSTLSFLSETNVPEEAVKNADVIVTDTWVSMGKESEKAARLKAFEGFQVTKELAERGGAREGWRFMHCMPRHPEEVSDEVFYGPPSLVFQEAENRLWAALGVLEGFVVNKGILKATSS